MTLIYQYPTLHSGILIKRYKRFFADVELDSGEMVTAHCPNTGPMTSICIPGHRVQLSYHPSPTRQLPYTWEMIEVASGDPASITPIWVGVNTALPNRIIKLALQQHLFPQLPDYGHLQWEVPYGQENSRIDFLLKPSQPDRPIDKQAIDERPIYVEVKNTTWHDGTLALFPDTVTSRGQKHIRELTSLLPKARAVMLYFINREDCDRFSPGDSADPKYGQLLRAAIAQGLEILPCRFKTTPVGVQFLGLADLLLPPIGSQDLEKP